MKRPYWIGYNELAWTNLIIAPPEEYAEETERFCRTIQEHSKIEPETVLHLGSGAGINDYTFKKSFKVTGVDISRGMLEVARNLNPEVTYFHGDIRVADLKKQFDAVVIPESINYMTTIEDARKTVITAYKHLKPGGVFLFATHIKEEFQENNFVYKGSKGSIQVTVFENNYIPDPEKLTYESTIIYLIRNSGKMEIYTDLHIIGLFYKNTWLDLLKECEFEVTEEKLDDTYAQFIMGEGKYPLRLFICTNKFQQ